MKKLSALLAVAVAAAALAVPALAGTRTVKIGDNWYVARHGSHAVTISHGTVVKWVWTGKVSHNVYQLSGPKGTHFHSPAKVHGFFKRRFAKRGTYQIVCTIHPGMDMTIHVK